ncbi:putative lipid II flippase FtsW [Microaerobacter geothermalis]|uniref:putative lipid II flippase FtsW n=1 Tax=Microaerobacter geothermalis TaxID=674972 RepID=UPI001F3A22D6|nr:putative lipid II flippase FtsW [Microaerobacter geothermalis]MCF6095303.1 putative lipid II flippase FtsW [Microaerobacter geothermalis]
MKPIRGTPDFFILFTTLLIVGFGITMLFSASSIVSYWEMNDRWFFTRKQIIWAILGLIGMLITMNIPYSFFKRWFVLILFVILILLSLVFVKGIGIEANNARSWIGTDAFTLQPAEFAKLGLIIYLAGLISKKEGKIQDLTKGYVPAVLIIGIIFILIAKQPDYGTAMIILSIGIVMLVIGGAKLKHLFLTGLPALAIITYYVFSAEYRRVRFASFLNPWEDRYESGWQLVQSLLAIGHGGITGTGFGKSIQKFMYIPYPQNDFIFSIMAEELGFVGVSLFIFVLILLIWRSILVTQKIDDPFANLLGIGIVSMIAIQTILNIGVVTGLLPNTGVPLPFISYGGSSLIVMMTSMGIILSISREVNRMKKEKALI